MKRVFKKAISVFTVATIILATFFIFPFAASGAVNEQSVKKINFWADPQGRVDSDNVTVTTDNGKTTVSALGLVQAHTTGSSYSTSTNDNYFLFLPTTADLDNLVLYFTNGTSSTAVIRTPESNDVTVVNGEPTNVFAGFGTRYTAAATWCITLGSTTSYFHVVKSSGVGTMYLNTASGSMATINASSDHSAKESGSAQVYNAKGAMDYNGGMDKLGGHGNYTWDTTNSKNSYNLKISSSASLLGMDKAKKWVLMSNNKDDSMLRNRITYDFAEYIGVEYQSEVQPVDLYCNGHYMGSYALIEKPEIKSNRIDVIDAYENLEIANGTLDTTTGMLTPADFDTFTNLTTNSVSNGYTIGNKRYQSGTNFVSPSDITGGYMFGIEICDRWVEESNGFCAYARQGWTVRSCDYITSGMLDYSYKLLYAMGSAVYQSNGNVPSGKTTQGNKTNILLNYETECPAPDAQYQGMHWSDLLDADSAVTYYWTQEFFKNMDASTTSTYFYKDSDSVDSKVYAGPVWDSDNAIMSSGSRYGSNFGGTDGWYVKNQRIYKFKGTGNTDTSSLYNISPYSFYAALSRQSDFWAMAEDMWYQTVSPAVNILTGASPADGKLHSVRWYAEELADTGTMDKVRFNSVSTTYNVESMVTYFTDWVANRKTWVNKQILTKDIDMASAANIPEQPYTGSPATPAVTLTYANGVLGNEVLEEGTDYTLSFDKNVNVGTANILVTGIGRFAGSTKKLTFEIAANSLIGGKLSINDGAYLSDEITPNLTDKNGLQIQSGVSYKWYVGGVLSGSDATYTVKNDDAGKTIYVVATGDGTSVKNTLTSNNCVVASTTRPTGTLKNIATFSYKYGDDGLSLQGSKKTGYSASAGVQKDTAKIFASVDGKNPDNLEWSGSDTFTRTDGTSGQQPIMSPSTNTPWQEYPYFDISFSTMSYSDISFVAELGATSKGAAEYAIMYSVNGSDFQYIYGPDAKYEYDYMYFMLNSLDKKVMKKAFDLTLPAVCENKELVTIRIIVDNPYTLEGDETLFTTTKTSGKIAINNVAIDGVMENNITGLSAPIIETDSSSLFKDDKIIITDTNSGYDVHYTLTGSDCVESEVYTYKGAFAPFSQIDCEAVTVSAWAESGIYKSETVSKTYSFAGNALARFNYQTYSSDVIAGKLPSNGGAFGKSSLMYTVADSTTQYVPLYNNDKKAFAISPDDGLKWSVSSGYYFELSTSGYESITFSCDAYTTTQGPKSMTLSYSFNGSTWTTVKQNQALPANGALEKYMDCVTINGIANQKKIYVRLTTQENQTLSGETLHNNASKGNVYINNIVVGGVEAKDVIKMPYTEKTTNYFGLTGTVKYFSPDGVDMQYSVMNGSGKLVSSGAYPAGGIQLSSIFGFNSRVLEPYTVSIWAGDDDDKSVANTRTYYYKGDMITEFSYSSSKFTANANSDATLVNATSGTGTLSMYPNGKKAIDMSYTGSYGVKVSATDSNTWTTTSTLNNAASKGYWLITASTLGYSNLTMSLEQITSNKGPRDWGIAYSTDGTYYSYLDNSNIRAIEGSKTTETYANISLPSALNNKEKVYIKVFINGGENLAGYEFSDLNESVGKGNTGIDNIEICGIGEPTEATATVKTTVLESLDATMGTIPMAGVQVYVNGENAGTTSENGTLSITVNDGTICEIKFDNGTFSRTIVTVVKDSAIISVPLVAIDLNKDGYINVRDFSTINKMGSGEQKTLYQRLYSTFMGVSDKTFEYA